MSQFKIGKVLQLPKMQLVATEYCHHFSKHKHLHVHKTNDANRVFALAFKTNAPNKTGVPHILEHTTLCGSRKYPLRDPFFKMLNRSLASFMNAMTGANYTYYPFATTNARDFQNLQSVYMDAVFKPNLKKFDFLQEGWRLEPRDLDLPISDENVLEFKGVVYNEMKGQLSMPAYLHYTKWLQAIYPNLGYSGGDPKYIPDLQWENLVEFHQQNYHRNNCFTFSYGDFDVNEVLNPLSRYLAEYHSESHDSGLQSASVSTPVPRTTAVELNGNVKRVGYGSLDPSLDPNAQYKSSLTWYLGPPDKVSKVLMWRVISMLLQSGHSSPMYQALIDSKLGTDFTVNSGIEETENQLMYTIGLEGLKREDIPKFQRAVFDCLEQIGESGFPNDRLAGLLHQFEFSILEVDANYGLNVLDTIIERVFTRNNDYMKLIDTEKLLFNFKRKLEKYPNVLQNEIKQNLGAHKPYFEYELVPSSSYERDVQKGYDDVLHKKVAEMNQEDIENVINEDKMLRNYANQSENVDILPTLQATDIRREVLNFEVSKKLLANQVPLITRKTTTQGIKYLKIMRDMNKVPSNLLPLLPIYAEALTNVGTQTKEMSLLEDEIRLNTGGINVSQSLSSWGSIELTYNASCLDSKYDHMLSLMTEVITEPKLSNKNKLQTILESTNANIWNVMSQSGQKYAVNRACAVFSKRRADAEKLNGFEFFKNLQSLKADDELVQKLQEIHSLPFVVRAVGLTESPQETTSTNDVTDDSSVLNKMITNVNAEKGNAAPTLSEFHNLNNEIVEPTRLFKVNAPFQISHVGSAINLPQFKLTDKETAALQILSTVMTQKYLHPEIREKGGAYGGGSSYDPVDSIFSLYSYRDPNPQNSVGIMQSAMEWASNYKFTDRDLTEGKIGVFQSLDSPVSPRHEISYNLGLSLTSEERQLCRNNLLNVTLADLENVSKLFLNKDQSFVIVGPPSNETEHYEHIKL